VGAAGISEHGRLGAAGLARARVVLAKAFHDYPLYRELFPDAGRRERALRWYMGFVVRYCLKYGAVFSTPDAEGFLTILKGPNRFPYRKLLATGFQFAPLHLGLVPCWRMIQHDNYVSSFTTRLAPRDGWYLWIMGVDPAVHWKRLGWELMRQALEAADAAGAPCYADTDRREMLGFLLFHGFEILYEGKAPTSGLPFWVVCRRAIMPDKNQTGE
jgi:GNAT superfamily N-acetyltransferase